MEYVTIVRTLVDDTRKRLKGVSVELCDRLVGSEAAASHNPLDAHA